MPYCKIIAVLFASKKDPLAKSTKILKKVLGERLVTGYNDLVIIAFVLTALSVCEALRSGCTEVTRKHFDILHFCSLCIIIIYFIDNNAPNKTRALQFNTASDRGVLCGVSFASNLINNYLVSSFCWNWLTTQTIQLPSS